MHRFSHSFIGLCFVLATAAACAASSGNAEDDGECAIGAELCQCTQGGVCDPGLQCLSGICVDPSSSSAGQGGATSNVGSGASGAGTTVGAGPSSGAGGDCAKEGCQAIDVLFALDHSASMQAEVGALAATQAFTAVIDALAAVNCGDIDYRVGLVDDNTPSFVTPNGWPGPSPWFDSLQLTKSEFTTSFTAAAQAIFNQPETSAGCEHVLSNATSLLTSDNSGFVRDEALLVLVLVTDVDDYGAYDQISGNSCNLGCSTPPTNLSTVHSQLLGLKANNDKALAAIVVAGDPSVSAGVNFRGQPGSCGCNQIDCDVFHATRLYQFAGMLAGSNGMTANLCNGPTTIPEAVKSAFASNIDLACKEFEPPK